MYVYKYVLVYILKAPSIQCTYQRPKNIAGAKEVSHFRELRLAVRGGELRIGQALRCVRLIRILKSAGCLGGDRGRKGSISWHLSILQMRSLIRNVVFLHCKFGFFLPRPRFVPSVPSEFYGRWKLPQTVLAAHTPRVQVQLRSVASWIVGGFFCGRSPSSS